MISLSSLRRQLSLVVRHRKERAMHKEYARLGVERLERRDNPSIGWSFWEDTYLGAVIYGVGQGALNTVNGVQDAVIGVANLPAMVYNNTIGYLGGGTIG
ncbi:MAG: hypothetical protein N2112_02985 [Gemmataceae bacterium]|nr:hypothetical protein [Gemmataceae bacterium]